MTTVTHVAGPQVIVGGRYVRQRCAWCGETLTDMDLRMVAVLEGDDAPTHSWPLMAQIRVDGAVTSVVEDEAHPDDQDSVKIPDDACFSFAGLIAKATPTQEDE